MTLKLEFRRRIKELKTTVFYNKPFKQNHLSLIFIATKKRMKKITSSSYNNAPFIIF